MMAVSPHQWAFGWWLGRTSHPLHSSTQRVSEPRFQPLGGHPLLMVEGEIDFLPLGWGLEFPSCMGPTKYAAGPAYNILW